MTHRQTLNALLYQLTAYVPGLSEMTEPLPVMATMPLQTSDSKVTSTSKPCDVMLASLTHVTYAVLPLVRRGEGSCVPENSPSRPAAVELPSYTDRWSQQDSVEKVINVSSTR